MLIIHRLIVITIEFGRYERLWLPSTFSLPPCDHSTFNLAVAFLAKEDWLPHQSANAAFSKRTSLKRMNMNDCSCSRKERSVSAVHLIPLSTIERYTFALRHGTIEKSKCEENEIL